MKRLSIIKLSAVILMAMPMKAAAQDTVFGVWQNYYYNWYEYWEHGIVHEGAASCIIYGGGSRPSVYAYNNNSNVPGFDVRIDKYVQEIAVKMLPDSALNVVGISIPVDSTLTKGYWTRWPSGMFGPAIRMGITTESIILHLNVYNKNMSHIYTQSKRLADIRDTTRYIAHGVDFYPSGDYNPLSHHTYFVPHFDFFFDTTLVLTDTFYISETMTSNDDTTMIYPCMREMGELHGMGGTSRILPWEKRMYRETLDDTVWQEEEYGWHVTCLFPIIERDGDTCPQVRDVQCFKGTSTQFFLRWASGVNHHDWQVSYGPAGTFPENGTVLECNQRQTSLITVDPDSHYVAYVRARCRFARDEWGPWSDSVSIWLNQPTDAIEYAFPDIAVTLTPNPAADAVTVSAEATLLTLELRDLLGRTVLSQQPSANSTTVDVSTLPAGTYILRLHTPQGVATKKLVVSR